MRIALHTRVRRVRIQEHEQAPAAVPPRLTDAIRASVDYSAAGGDAALPVAWRL